MYSDRGRLPKSCSDDSCLGNRKIQENPWKLRAGKRYTDKLSNILEEFPAEQRNIPENSCLWTGILTDLKGFCENSWLGKRISGKIPGFIRETYSRLERVCSVTSWLGAWKATGTFLQCSSAKENFKNHTAAGGLLFRSRAVTKL